MDSETQTHLNHVLAAIRASTTHLIRVVKHLQDESRRPLYAAQDRLSVQSFASVSTENGLPTTPQGDRPTILADVLDQPGGKRKRSITHFDGIPIAFALRSPAVAPADRPVITSRRMRELDEAMQGLCVDRQANEPGAYEDEEESDDDLVIII